MENDERTEEELKSIARFFGLFGQVFPAIAAIKHEEAFQAKVKERLGNHRKYLRAKARRREGGK